MKPRREPLHLLSPIHRAYRQVGTYLEARCRALGVSNPEGHLLTYLGSYSPAPVGDIGTGIQVGIDAGADVALMDDAWWGA